ncbi:MAG TPA: ABC transporter substrate-binding protein [Hyphomicrobiaceae bacterium]|jgi:NitT/TauT family transport system substrate-binding protein|nr:ABC transporter substrate-binding protein [Hyphomicrobiaceae bacterium]
MRASLLVGFACLALWPSAGLPQTSIVRIGHFPNITHVQGLVAHHLTRHGRGWFEQRLGRGVKIEWFVYNAGPSAMEAILANSIDLTYVGPNPAINAYAKSRGREIRIVAGAANGGAALVVQPDSQLMVASDFRGRRIATPQLGNTQDVAARAWLAAGGLRITQTGGEAHVIPTSNPDQLVLFKQKQLDAVWTVEPWVSRLEMEARATVLLEEPDAVTTVLVSSVRFLSAHRQQLRTFVAAHQELTEWIKANPEEAQRMVREELAAETRTSMPAELVERAWRRIVVTSAVSPEALNKFMTNAQSAGFLRGVPDLSGLIERP